MQKHGA